MARGKKSAEISAEMRKDRLRKHLNEVEDLGRSWIKQLTAPNPFYWRESDESWATRPDVKAAQAIRFPESPEEKRWKMWACREAYVPLLEQDVASNHMLRKHLRKRALWHNHSEWEQRLNRIAKLAPALCERAAKMQEERGVGRELTEDYMPTALQAALEFASGQASAKSYSQRPGFTRGVWYEGMYGGVLIDKSASSQQVDAVKEGHWQIISELGQSNEMRQLAREWQQVQLLQERMRELAHKAVKSGDILFPCQFCRRLWQE